MDGLLEILMDSLLEMVVVVAKVTTLEGPYGWCPHLISVSLDQRQENHA